MFCGAAAHLMLLLYQLSIAELTYCYISGGEMKNICLRVCVRARDGCRVVTFAKGQQNSTQGHNVAWKKS